MTEPARAGLVRRSGLSSQQPVPAAAPVLPEPVPEDASAATFGHALADVSIDAAGAAAPAFRFSSGELDLIREALNRGAPDELIVDMLLRRGLDNPPPAPPLPLVPRRAAAGEADDEITGRELAVGLARSRIRAALVAPRVAFEADVAAEYAGLSPVAKPSFGIAKGESYGSPLEKYQALRAAYYREGWTHPKHDIFDHIVEAKILGEPIIGGVHQLMVPILEQMARQLSPEVIRAFAAGTLQVGGFVPRFIAGTGQLSNHAFGLALDIDPDRNPHLKGEGDLAAFERAVGVDLGERFFAGSEPARETQTRLDEISLRLRAWLAIWLPQYEALLDARQRSQRGSAKERAAASREAASLQRDIALNPAAADLRALDTLVRNHGIATVRSWQQGLGTIPPEVVDVFRQLGTEYGARRGTEYEKSKDLMHLELQAPIALPKAAGRPRPIDMLDVVPAPGSDLSKPQRRRR